MGQAAPGSEQKHAAYAMQCGKEDSPRRRGTPQGSHGRRPSAAEAPDQGMLPAEHSRCLMR